MAPDPQDANEPGSYAESTSVNTDRGWLNAPGGGSLIGAGVDVNLHGMTGYSKNLDTIQSNFAAVGMGLTTQLLESATTAFPAGQSNLHWTNVFLNVSQHNAQLIGDFLSKSPVGIRNTAMAAQAVADALGNADATSAATLNAVDFAFGDRSKAPPGFPRELLDRLQTWDEYTKQHQLPAMPINPDTGQLPPGAQVRTETSADGRTVKTTVVVPMADGTTQTIVNVTSTWTVHDHSWQTQSRYVDGRLMSTTETSVSNGRTQTAQYETVYDTNGTAVRTQLASHTAEQVTYSPNGTQQTQRTVTSYSYDPQGNQTQHPAVTTTKAVGVERPIESTASPATSDPATAARLKIVREHAPPPTAPQDQILAPGPGLGGATQATSPAPGSGTA